MQTTDSKFTTRNISRLYGAAYKFVNITDMFYYFMFLKEQNGVIFSSGTFHCLEMNQMSLRRCNVTDYVAFR